jgi:hypothetical protein
MQLASAAFIHHPYVLRSVGKMENTLKGGHRTAPRRAEALVRFWRALLGVHPLGCSLIIPQPPSSVASS